MVFACLNTALKFIFNKFGRLIGRFPIIFLIVTSLLLIGTFFGFRNLRISFDIVNEFTPSDALSIQENQAHAKFYHLKPILELIDSSDIGIEPILIGDNNDHDQSISSHRRTKREVAGQQNYFQIIRLVYLAKDGGSVLRQEYLHAISDFNSFIRNDFVQFGGNLTYVDLCGSVCELDPQIHLFMKIMKLKIHEKSKSIQPTYPIMTILGRKIQIGEFLFGVSLNKTDNHTIQEAKAILFNYGVFTNDPHQWQAYLGWRDDLLLYVHNPSRSLHGELTVSFTSGDIVLTAMRTTALSSLPYLLVIMPLMLLFTIISTIRKSWSESKPFVCVFGLICPLLACAGTFGILFGLGMPYQPIVTVALYLALAVGVDDMYLMLYAWHRSKLTAAQIQQTDNNSVSHRMGRTLEAAGPSISITSFTNAISFASGLWATTPAIRDFCLTASVSMLMDFVLQLCLFAPFLALAARGEISDSKTDQEQTQKSKREVIFSDLSTAYTNLLQKVTALIISPVTAVITIMLLLVYYSISIYGLTLTKVDMKIDRFLLPGTPIHSHYQIEREYLVNGVHPLFLYAMQPGDLRNRTQWSNYLQALSEIESLNGMLGANSTVCWLKQYFAFLAVLGGKQFSEIDFADYRNIDVEFTYEYLEDFLLLGSNDIFRPLLVGHMSECAHNTPDCIQKFACRTAFIRTGDWNRDLQLMHEWRTVAAKYKATIGLVPWYYESFLMDQVSTILPSTYRTVLTTTIAMFCVCALTVPKPVSVIIAMLGVFSVNLGVLGLGTLWGVDLDLLAMGALLAAVGFSVDYISHVIYHYSIIERSECASTKVLHTLQSIAYPTTQAAVSSLICMGAIYFHPTYYLNMFAKIVILTVVSGYIHGLFLIPMLLANIDRLLTKCCS